MQTPEKKVRFIYFFKNLLLQLFVTDVMTALIDVALGETGVMTAAFSCFYEGV